MSVEARLHRLDERHQALDGLIEEERRRPSSDEVKLHELKRAKLALKDEMHTLRAQEKSA